MNYLHKHDRSQSVLHRDIKSANIVLMDDFTPKIINCGLSYYAPNRETTTTTTIVSTTIFANTSDRIYGTLEYTCPEYLNNQNMEYDEQCDIYSYGIVLLELLVGRHHEKDYLDLTDHFNEKLEELDRYINPFVFRCTRKNKYEQFLSEVAVHHIGNSFRNIEKDGPTQDIESFYNFTKQRIKIDFKNVVKFMRRKENEDYLWNEYASLYENYTLYYEDMSVPFDIPALNLYNVTIEHRTEKLPDYKRDVFTNYDQVVEWFSKF